MDMGKTGAETLDIHWIYTGVYTGRTLDCTLECILNCVLDVHWCILDCILACILDTHYSPAEPRDTCPLICQIRAN